jgi:POT family proton-dependent oligopeptide transporter
MMPAPVSPDLVQNNPVEERHPRGLYVLFLSEMWERFSFYGMRALLMLYMLKRLSFTQPHSSLIYGSYIGFVYFTTIFGGAIADQWLGYKNTILIGGVLMMVGHFLMAVENLPFFFIALFFLVIGCGCFKANVSTVVGKLYRPGDPRRDRGFSIFYVGINVGATAAPLICGWLAERYGYGWGFAAAGVGMLIGLVTFWLGQPLLSGIDLGKPAPRVAAVDTAAPNEDPTTERGRIAALGIVCFFVIFFWAAYEQCGNTLTLFAEENTIRTLRLPWIGEYTVPTSWFQSVNPGFILLLTPFLNVLWRALGHRGREPSTGAKMAAGLGLLAISFVVMVAATVAGGGDRGMVGMSWLVWSYFFATVGELCLSPIGLSLVTKLAPARLGGMLMGVWFVATFAGNFLSGQIGVLWSRFHHGEFFTIFVISSAVASTGLFLLLRPLKRLMAGAA